MGHCTLAGEVTGHFAMECEYMFQSRKVREFFFPLSLIFERLHIALFCFFCRIVLLCVTNYSKICVQINSFLNDKFFLFISDISKALILTEIGAKRDPHTLDIFLGNMKHFLSAPVHG